MGESIRIREAEHEDLPAIVKIHKSQKKWLGHLPYSVFIAAIRASQLLVAEGGEGVEGYLLYRTRSRTNDAAITHLAVSADSSGLGIGRKLVDGLVDAVADRRRVVLRCRKDYPAHQFWISIGFEAVSEAPGNAADGALLTLFERRLSVLPSLFDDLYESHEPFAVDLNVLLDLISSREQGQISRDVWGQLDQFNVNPVRTTALMNELSLHNVDDERRLARSFADAWQAAGRTAQPEELEGVRERAPGVHDRDARHLADAEANSISFLLTRDSQFEAAALEAEPGGLQVRVVDPAAFLDQLVDAEPVDYRPLQAAGLRHAKVVDYGLDRLAREFLCQERGETKITLKTRLRELLAHSAWIVEPFELNGRLAGLAASRRKAGIVEVGLFRLARRREAVSIGRHIAVHLRRRWASQLGTAFLSVTDTCSTAHVERALTAEGWLREGSGRIAVSMSVASSMDDVADRLASVGYALAASGLDKRLLGLRDDAVADPRAHADLELALDPLVVSDSCLPALLVPIRAGWSDRLLGVTPSQLDIDLASQGFGMFRENAYFRSPRGIGQEAPFRVFWYRTGDPPSRVFAVSTIVKVLVADLSHVWGRFSEYGVLRRSDLDDVSRNGRAMAMRIVGTHILRQELTLEGLNQAGLALGINRISTPRAPRRIDPLLARWILENVGVR